MVAQKAFYCTLYDAHGVLGKVDGTIYFFGDDGSITEFTPDMSPWVCILGQVALTETARLLDALHGGAAAIACGRRQEV
jgi:hypothetical protein